jgi:hypothetical protein
MERGPNEFQGAHNPWSPSHLWSSGRWPCPPREAGPCPRTLVPDVQLDSTATVMHSQLRNEMELSLQKQLGFGHPGPCVTGAGEPFEQNQVCRSPSRGTFPGCCFSFTARLCWRRGRGGIHSAAIRVRRAHWPLPQSPAPKGGGTQNLRLRSSPKPPSRPFTV